MRRSTPTLVALLVVAILATGCASTDLSRYSPAQARAYLDTLQTLRVDTLTLAAQLYRDGLISDDNYRAIDRIDTGYRLAWWQAANAVDALDMIAFERFASRAQSELARLTAATEVQR